MKTRSRSALAANRTRIARRRLTSAVDRSSVSGSRAVGRFGHDERAARPARESSRDETLAGEDSARRDDH
jgi:hypothetical protein